MDDFHNDFYNAKRDQKIGKQDRTKLEKNKPEIKSKRKYNGIKRNRALSKDFTPLHN